MKQMLSKSPLSINVWDCNMHKLFMVKDYMLCHGYDGKHVFLLTGNSCSSAAEKQNILLHKEPVRAAKGDSLIPVYQFFSFCPVTLLYKV